ncbi:MAG: MBL fold metallo-hydrolase [Gammaproteobacteria bacterium]|nr:MBL fold metallo-hydrolase [Gammaproteobacteria bacterium]
MQFFSNRKTLAGLLAALLASLPVTAAAQDQEVEYAATALSPTVTMIKGRGGNIAVSSGEDGVFIIDDQLKPLTDQLLGSIRTVSDRPIRFVINTHYHADHVGGNETIGGSGAVIIAHDNIRERMSTDQFNHFWKETTPAWPKKSLPVVTFNDQVTLHLNGEAVKVTHVPRGHTDGDSIVHFPTSNVIHMGDIFFNGLYPYIDLDGGGTIQGMIAAVELGISLADDETQVIPGHGPMSDLQGLKEYHEFLTRARDNVQALIDQGMSLDQVVAAKPTAEWDDILGKVWITPEQLVIFIFNSLTGVDHFTPLEPQETTTE